MKCPYCQHSNLYNLSTGQKKCAKCKKKFSPRKLNQQIILIEKFCKNYTVNEISKELNINYTTIKKSFEQFRKLITQFLEEQYQLQYSNEYDEYIYMPKSKKKVKENIFDAQNFLTFEYDNKVYNLLMPNLNNKYKHQFLDDGLDDVYFKEFSRFMMFNKIAKFNKQENIITKFWNFFEDFILKYKGISSENFIYYLKECEFKFNYTQNEAQEILLHLVTEHNYAKPRSIP